MLYTIDYLSVEMYKINVVKPHRKCQKTELKMKRQMSLYCTTAKITEQVITTTVKIK